MASPTTFDLPAWWAWVSSTQATLPWWAALLLLLGGSLVALNGKVWLHTRLLAVYFHESGHALVALLTGRRLLGIRLHADGSGSTLHEGPAWGLGRFLTAFAGYPAPAAVAWLVLYLSSDGHSRAAVAVLAAICLVLLVFQRSWRGWALTGAVLASCALLGSSGGLVPAIAMTSLAGYLFAAAPRSIWELHRARRIVTPGEQHSDADSLASMTGIPPVIWELAFLALSAWLLWQGLPVLL